MLVLVSTQSLQQQLLSRKCAVGRAHLKVVSEVLKLAAPGVPELRKAVQKKHQRLAATATRCDRVEPAVPQCACQHLQMFEHVMT